MKSIFVKSLSLIIGAIFLFFGFVFIRNQSWFSDFNADVLVHKYSPEEIDHFSKFAFQDGRLKKWTKNIKVLIQDKESIETSVLQRIEHCVNELNNIVEEVDCYLDEYQNNYNVKIMFSDEFHNRYGVTIPM